MDRNDGVLLTAREVQGWRDRKAELDREIAEAQRELAEIDRRLEAAAVLTDRAGGGDNGVAVETAPADQSSDEDDGFGSPVAG
jgi:hypothetical protein